MEAGVGRVLAVTLETLVEVLDPFGGGGAGRDVDAGRRSDMLAGGWRCRGWGVRHVPGFGAGCGVLPLRGLLFGRDSGIDIGTRSGSVLGAEIVAGIELRTGCDVGRGVVVRGKRVVEGAVAPNLPLRSAIVIGNVERFPIHVVVGLPVDVLLDVDGRVDFGL